MKRIIALLSLLLCTLLLLFVGCDQTNSGNNSSGNDLTAISDLLKSDYSKIHISVTTESEYVSIKNEFGVSFSDTDVTTISYVVNTANEITTDENGNLVIPSSAYTQKTGTVEVSQDGSVTLISGDEVDYDFSNLSKFSINLSKNNLSNIELTDIKLNADVKNPNALLNASDLDANNCTLSIYFYPGEAVKNVKINYEKKNGEEVKIVYNFTK